MQYRNEVAYIPLVFGTVCLRMSCMFLKIYEMNVQTY